MIGSPEINKVVRHVLSPVLRQHGFTRVQTRKNWGWHGPCTWVLEICAVGSYFGYVTGWPPMSVAVWLGVFYDFIPAEFSGTVKVDSDGKPLPREYQCHMRSHLACTLDQSRYKLRLDNPAERARNDLWWIEPDGSNVEGVIQAIMEQYLVAGLPWFERQADLPAIYTEIQQEPESVWKFWRAAAFASQLQLEAEYRKYRELMIQEAQRIGRTGLLAQYS